MLRVTLTSPVVGTVFAGEAEMVSLATDLGAMEVLPGHASCVGVSRATPVLIRQAGNIEQAFMVRDAAVCIVQDGADTRMDIAAAQAESKGETSLESLKSYREKILEAMARKEDLSTYQMELLTEHLGSVDKAIALQQE